MDPEVSKIISSLKNSPDIKYTSKEALMLIDHGQEKVVGNYINNFTDLNAEVAEKLIERRMANFVAYYKDIFTGYKLNAEAAIKMMDHYQAGVVIGYIYNFNDLNAKVAEKLIEWEKAYYVLQHPNRFVGFKLNAETAIKMIVHAQARDVIENIDKFTGFKLDSAAALKIIEYGQAQVVIENKNLFEGFELDSDTALKIMEYDQANGGFVIDTVFVKYIDDFSDLNAEVANRLIEGGLAMYVLDYKDKFVGFELDSDAALKMIENWQALVVIENKDLFDGFILDSAAALKIIEYGQAGVVINNINRFVGLNTEVIVKLLNTEDSKELIPLLQMRRQNFDIEGILKDKDKNLSFNSYYLYEIVKHPSLISDICS